MTNKQVNHAQGDGGAWKRVDQTQDAYDDSALTDSLAELADSERERVEEEKPER